MQQTSYGASGLDLIREAVKAEVGEFYQKPDGVMYLRGREDIVSEARSSVSQATYGSNRAGGEIPYVGRPATSWDRSQLHNRVVAGLANSTAQQVAEDSASVARYGYQSVEETSLQLPNEDDALSWAHYVLAQDATPEVSYSAITLNGALELIGVSVMIQCLTRRMGDRVTIVRRPPAQPYGSIVDSRDVHINGISHSWSNRSKQWITEFALRPAAETPFFVIGSATQGKIGTNVIAW